MRVRLLAAFGLCLLLALAPHGAGAQPQPPADTPREDALTPPPPPPSLDATGSRGPSQYMAGHVAVQVILPESSAGAESWSQGQIDQIRDQIQAALDWWVERLPEAHLHFTLRLQVAPTAYEPIDYGLASEGLWIGDVLRRLGFSGSSYFDQVYAADNALRASVGSDWATTIFVVNSENNTGSTFPDGRFAYAYINGPFMVLTSDVGAYGASRMAPVVAHELGHIFGALDQYATALVSCSQTSGYLNVPTTNSQYNNCGTHVPSIMIETLGAFSRGEIDPAALAQLGYRDSDGDGLIDPLDTTPQVTLSPPLVSADDNRPILSGQSTDLPFLSPIQQSVSVNRISAIEYRVDGGIWLPVSAADGAFDSAAEPFATTLPLYDGKYVVEARACNSVGNCSPVAGRTVTVSQVGPQPDYRPGLPAFSASTTVQIQLGAPATTQAVQISNDLSFADAAWQPYQDRLPFSLRPADGAQRVYVRYRDAAGRVSLPFALPITLDTTPPDGQVLRDPQRPQRLIVQAHDDGTGVVAIGLQVNEELPLWMPYQADIDLSGLSSLAATPNPADVHVRVLFRDAAGNTSAPYTITDTYVVNLPLIIR